MPESDTATKMQASTSARDFGVPGNFTALASKFAEAAIEATDAGDEAGFQRALAYRAALRRMAERWAAGEASPMRSAPSKAEGA